MIFAVINEKEKKLGKYVFLRRAAGGSPRRKRTHGRKRPFRVTGGDANGHARSLFASVLRRAVGDALTEMLELRTKLLRLMWQSIVKLDE